MKTIYKVLSDCGRVTIPFPIRISMDLSGNDILSFRQDGDEIIVRKEKICDGCGMQKKKSTDTSLFALLDNLSPEHQFNALTHLSLRWAEQNQK